MSKVVASIVVDFSSDSSSDSATLSAELDEIRNDSKTTFSIGDEIYFRVFKPSDDFSYTVSVSDGFAVVVTRDVVEKVFEETATFLKSNTFSPSKVPASTGSSTAPEITWYGTSGAVIIKNGAIYATGKTESFVGIGELKYASKFDVWKLISPSTTETEYKVVIYIEEA